MQNNKNHFEIGERRVVWQEAAAENAVVTVETTDSSVAESQKKVDEELSKLKKAEKIKIFYRSTNERKKFAESIADVDGDADAIAKLIQNEIDNELFENKIDAAAKDYEGEDNWNWSRDENKTRDIIENAFEEATAELNPNQRKQLEDIIEQKLKSAFLNDETFSEKHFDSKVTKEEAEKIAMSIATEANKMKGTKFTEVSDQPMTLRDKEALIKIKTEANEKLSDIYLTKTSEDSKTTAIKKTPFAETTSKKTMEILKENETEFNSLINKAKELGFNRGELEKILPLYLTTFVDAAGKWADLLGKGAVADMIEETNAKLNIIATLPMQGTFYTKDFNNNWQKIDVSTTQKAFSELGLYGSTEMNFDNMNPKTILPYISLNHSGRLAMQVKAFHDSLIAETELYYHENPEKWRGGKETFLKQRETIQTADKKTSEEVETAENDGDSIAKAIEGANSAMKTFGECFDAVKEGKWGEAFSKFLEAFGQAFKAFTDGSAHLWNSLAAQIPDSALGLPIIGEWLTSIKKKAEKSNEDKKKLDLAPITNALGIKPEEYSKAESLTITVEDLLGEKPKGIEKYAKEKDITLGANELGTLRGKLRKKENEITPEEKKETVFNFLKKKLIKDKKNEYLN